MNTLRPYQDRDLKEILEWLKTNNDCLYQLPTGGGKSVIMEHVVIHHSTSKILILAHKRELVFQMRKRLQERGLRVGVIIGNIEEELDADIIVGSIRTVTGDKRIQTILDKNFDMILVDEAHHIRTSSYEKVIDTYADHNPSLKLIGVTATPYRKDKKPLNKYFSKLICNDDIETLQKNNFLARFRVFSTPTKELSDVETSGNDYQLLALSSFMREEQMLNFLVDAYEKEGNNNQMLIFCVDKKHAKDVMAKYKERGYKSIKHIDSDTKLEERAKILLDFAKGLVQIITCIETLTEGVDLPETKCIQLARPTQSLVLYLQMVGRGLRLKSDGSECIILDNAGCCKAHKLPNSKRHWSLNPDIDPSNPGKKNRIVGRRKDGSFTEDEDEMAFLELIEMTPEEFVANMTNGIELSEEHNKKIETKIYNKRLELANFLVSKMKNPGWKPYDIKLGESQFSLNYVQLSNGSGKEIKLNYNDSRDVKLKFDSQTFWGDKGHLDVLVDVGHLSEELRKPKNHKTVIDAFRELNDIKEEKIDISELKKQADEFKEEQTKIRLSNYLIENNVVELPKQVSLGNIFRDLWYRDRCTVMIFGKNKLLGTNEVELIDKEFGTHIKKSLKVDKVMEIIKMGDW